MTDEKEQRLHRENAYLKARCAQLQDDVVSLSSELDRLRSRFEDALGRRRSASIPNPLGGGQ